MGRARRQRFTTDDAEDVLEANELSAEGARIQERSSDAGDFIKVQVGDQPAEVGESLRQAFAEAAGVDVATSTSTSSAPRGVTRSPRRRSGRW